MRYQSTPGLRDEDIDDLVRRVQEVLESRNQSLKGYRLGVRQQVEITLVLLRHNISQALAADMYGISQPTVSRVWRRMVPLLTHVLAMSGITLAQAVSQGSLLLYRRHADSHRQQARGRQAGREGRLLGQAPRPVPERPGRRHRRWLRPGTRLAPRQRGAAPVRLGPGPGRRRLDRRYRLHLPRRADPHQEDSPQEAPAMGKIAQQDRILHARRYRARHRHTEEMEDPVHRLPPPPGRAPRHHRPGHQARPLQNRLVTPHMNNTLRRRIRREGEVDCGLLKCVIS